MDAELEQATYDAEEEKALNADIERYHEYQRRHEAPTVYADPASDRRPSNLEGNMRDEWEALQGDVAMLGEILERFMVATLNGERDEAAGALEELQDLLASWEELVA